MHAQIYDLTEERMTLGNETSVQGIRAWGVTENGETVSVLITNIPYEIFIDPTNATSSINVLAHELDKRLLAKPNKTCGWNCVLEHVDCLVKRRTDISAVSECSKLMARGFEIYEENQREFWRFQLTRAYYSNPAKYFFENENMDVYECCPNAVEAFVRLKNFAGFNWYGWPLGLRCSFADFKEMEWRGMAKFRRVEFDIELDCVKFNIKDSDDGSYPIACICVDDGTRVSYAYGAAVDGENVRLYKTELDMLQAFKRERLEGAHFVSGWNSDGFDLPYVMKRGVVLGDSSFAKFSDGREVKCVKDKDDNKKMYCPGLISLDYCTVIKRDTRVRPYDFKLQTIGEFYGLGGKSDMPYSEIHQAANGSSESRGRLVEYCARNVELTRLIGKKIGAFTKTVARCRVKRILPRDDLYRGTSFVNSRKVQEYIKGEYLMMSWRETYVDGVKSKRLPDCMRAIDGYVEKVHEQGYSGGFVREPVVGRYRNVGTLDFASLYPSIIRTYNMCRSTQLRNATDLPADRVWVSDLGFAYAQNREGVIPRIMSDMVDERNKVRKQAETETDPDVLEQYDALQTEYKVLANGLYGLMGADTSGLVQKAIAASTCARGAVLAKKACELISEHAKFKHVFELLVVYGDTDSLMIDFPKSGGDEETLAWLLEVAHYINVESGILGTKGILKMAVEDVGPMLLTAKKQYCKYARGVERNTLKPPKIKICGMDTRSKTPHVRMAQRKMFEASLRDGLDVRDMYVRAIQDVALGLVPARELLHTAQLNKPTEEYENQAHVVAARQMQAAGLEVRVGDRISYYRVGLIGSDKSKASSVVADAFVNDYELDWAAYAQETIDTFEPLASLITDYDKVSKLSHYHLRECVKRSPPMQIVRASVGSKRLAQAGAGAMDAFVKRTKKTDAVKRSGKIRKAKGREFDEMDLL